MFLHYLDRCLAEAENRRQTRAQRQARLMMLPVEEYDDLPERRIELQAGRQALMDYEACRQRASEELERQRRMRQDYDQTRLHDSMRNTDVKNMFQKRVEDLEMNRAWLRNTYQIIEVHETVVITFPRRSGKTLTETLDAAITMLSQRGGNVMAINPKKHQARDWLTQIKEHLELLKDDDTWGFQELEYRAGEIYKIRANYTGEVVEVVSRGNAGAAQFVASLRGGGKRIRKLYCDEAFFFCDEAWPVIFPLAANGCALVLTSSMAHKQQTLFQIRDARYKDGCPIVKVIDYRASCNECLLREQQTGVEVHCTHVVRPPKHFRTRTDEERLEALMSPFGSYDREMLNIPPSATAQRIFTPVRIDSWSSPMIRRAEPLFT
jgi:hypothetical protein